MRFVDCPGVGAVSALGFGCASLGSRISENPGRAAIERALAAGITWFDVAPSYGDGNAERILGEALQGTNAHIGTKVGIVAPHAGGAKRMAAMVARPLLNAVPALRPLMKSMRGPAAAHIALTPDAIRSSIDRSLARLKRDHLAMLALHDPSPDDVRDDAVIRTLADIKAQGLVRGIGIAGSIEAINAARSAGLDITIAQFANDPFVHPITGLSADIPFRITHSVFGVSGALDRLRSMMRDPSVNARFASLGRTDAAALLLDYAFAVNATGVVLASSYDPAHLASNASAAAGTHDHGACR